MAEGITEFDIQRASVGGSHSNGIMIVGDKDLMTGFLFRVWLDDVFGVGMSCATALFVRTIVRVLTTFQSRVLSLEIPCLTPDVRGEVRTRLYTREESTKKRV